VHTDDAAHIASVVLMRNTAQTHLVDGDGRTVALPVLSRAEHSVVVGLPSTTAVLPNGPYLLFANKSKTADLSGRDAAALLPSRAEQVYVTGRAVPTVFLPSAAQFHGSSVAAPTIVSRSSATTSARSSRATVSAPAATTPALDLVARREHRPAGVPDGLTWLAIAALGLAVGGHLVRRRA
jgi:hypothetical protein